MLRIAVQSKGRLNEESLSLLADSGIKVRESKRTLISRAEGFDLEVLYLRDDDIPQAVAMGVADLGIVGLNEVREKNFEVDEVMALGFGACRLSLAVPKGAGYDGLGFFNGKRVATSYPGILGRFFQRKGSKRKSIPSKGLWRLLPPPVFPRQFSISCLPVAPLFPTDL